MAEQQPPAGATAPPAGQAPAEPAPGEARDERGGGGRGSPVLPFEDRTGFESMFNGTSLDPGEQQMMATERLRPRPRRSCRRRNAGAAGVGGGTPPVSRFKDWDGDPKFWRAENGMIVGESTPEKAVGPNTFLIWRGGEPGDFELKVEIRMNSTNSGIQYRSKMLPPNEGGGDNPGKLACSSGYQMDIDFANQYHRDAVRRARPGVPRAARKITYIAPDGTRARSASSSRPTQLKATFKPGEWNQFHLIARGNTLIHIVNGHVTAVCIDDDLKGRSMAGPPRLPDPCWPANEARVRNICDQAEIELSALSCQLSAKSFQSIVCATLDLDALTES